ncbi:MAG: hypothetical protein KDI51_07010 [Xanthomonadales bacterium]|nr:hypothetical protein [Xanthomonadales bacterium]
MTSRSDFSRVRFGLMLLLLNALLAGPAAMAAGRLDPLFGIGGRQVIAYDEAPNFADRGYAIVAQADERLVLVGTVQTENDRLSLGATRLLPNGQVDTSFGSFEGRLVLRDAAGQYLVPLAAAVQADNRIVVSGARYPVQPVGIDGGTEGTPASIEWFVLRLQANGSGLDSSFGSGGIVLLDFGREQEYGTAVAIQSDGRILVAGQLDSALINPRMALTRLLASGALDTSFAGGDGLYDDSFSAAYDRSTASRVLLQSDGRILLGGTARKIASPFDEDMALVRLLANGAVDSSFGNLSAGRSIVDFSIAGLPRDDRIHALAYRPPLISDTSRRIVIGGQVEPGAGPQLAGLAVLTYGGQLDPGFSGDGKLEFSSGFDNSQSGVYTISLERIDPTLLETSDRITFGGILPNVVAPACFLGRITYSGALDIGFNGGGLLSIRTSPASVKDECRDGVRRGERYFLAGTNAINMTMTGDDFVAFAVLTGSFLFRDGFEAGAN